LINTAAGVMNTFRRTLSLGAETESKTSKINIGRSEFVNIPNAPFAKASSFSSSSKQFEDIEFLENGASREAIDSAYLNPANPRLKKLLFIRR